LEEIFNAERNMVHVGCTRARDHGMVAEAGLALEFLQDLQEASQR
jgi:hypothetical protein